MPRGRAGAGRGAEGPAGRLRGWRGSGRGRAEHPPAGGRRRAGQLGRSESHTDSTSGGRGGFWPSELQEKALLVLSHFLFCPPLRGRGKGEVPVKPNARSAAEVSEKDIFSRGLSIHSHLYEVWESVKLLPGSLTVACLPFTSVQVFIPDLGQDMLMCLFGPKKSFGFFSLKSVR